MYDSDFECGYCRYYSRHHSVHLQIVDAHLIIKIRLHDQLPGGRIVGHDTRECIRAIRHRQVIGNVAGCH